MDYAAIMTLAYLLAILVQFFTYSRLHSNRLERHINAKVFL